MENGATEKEKPAAACGKRLKRNPLLEKRNQHPVATANHVSWPAIRTEETPVD